MSASLAHGFSDPVHDAQRAFRAIMNALARPGTPYRLGQAPAPPAPLSPDLAAVALALADHEAPIWLDERLAAEPAVAGYLRFHTGATLVAEPAQAAFALVSDAGVAPTLDRFAQGTLEYPDRSTTLILAAATLTDGPRLRIGGPGIDGEAALAVGPLPQDFAAQWSANGALFPRGVDLLFVAADAVVGLPRSTRVLREG